MQSLKQANAGAIGTKEISREEVVNLLMSMRLHLIEAMKPPPVKAVLQSVSLHLISLGRAGSGRGRVGWAQACPKELLLNMWVVPGVSSFVGALDLFPPWHRSSTRKGLEMRCGAPIIAAMFSDFWRWRMHNIFSPEVPFMPRLADELGEMRAMPAASPLKRLADGDGSGTE